MTRKPIQFFDEPTDFSLVQGGPLFQLLLRSGLLKPPVDLATRRILAISLMAWLPLLVLAIIAGHAISGPEMPFLSDLGTHARFLGCVPILIAAEVIVHARMKTTVRQFLDRGIIAPEDQPKFEAMIASAMRLRNSIVAEVVIFLLAVFVGHSLAGRYNILDKSSWYAMPGNGTFQTTTAGYWYFFVSLPIFRFILFRWYFRLFVWYRFLWQVSRRVPLQLNALHPDGAGGLGFLSNSMYAFAPVLVAHTVALSGIIGGKIWHDGAKLPQFQMEIVAWLLWLMLLVLAPQCFFIFRLADAKRAGLREYGIVASRYVSDFRKKWIQGQVGQDEALIGTADIQSLADLNNSFEVVREMRLVPFGRAAVIRLAFVTLLPLAPLTLTMIPLEQLIDRAVQVFI